MRFTAGVAKLFPYYGGLLNVVPSVEAEPCHSDCHGKQPSNDWPSPIGTNAASNNHVPRD